MSDLAAATAAPPTHRADLPASVRRLVAAKDALPHGQEIWPATFAHAVLPFWTGRETEGPAVARVDATLVLGAHFQGYPAPSPAEAARTMARLDRLAERWRDEERGDGNLAQYQQIGGLPLYVAREGKNRVALYRAHGRLIAAAVTPTEYPEADALTLHELRPFGGWALACADERYWNRYGGPLGAPDVAVLAFPDASLPFLRAYGARDAGRRWSWRARRAITRERTAVLASRCGD